MSAEGPWRIGQHYGIHVYEGERPVATFHDAADAERAVAAVNASASPVEACFHAGHRVTLRPLRCTECED